MKVEKIHIPNVMSVEDFAKFTELFLIVPFIEFELYTDIVSRAKWWNEGMYTKLFFNPPTLKKVNIEDCDIVCIPFKYDTRDTRIYQICSHAKTHNKRVVCFYNDDNTDVFNLPENLILFRTSALKSKLTLNERIMPVIVPDQASYERIHAPLSSKGIGFCGHQEGIREAILKRVCNTVGKENCDFIVRQGFYYSTNKVCAKTKREYHDNITRNRFTLCIRGAGNFSIRFYEALSMGRIPILIDTDIVLPFEQIINWSNFIIKIKEDQINELPRLIQDCNIQSRDVREMWEKYFTPTGYTANFMNDI